ncbi:hypothetical protein FQN57_003669 [Myotisia sp. PD_48]|nr:hypothetical protein FQN57_003669 [Myotisia sp. PD_48]
MSEIPLSFSELEAAARAVIEILQGIPELSSAKIAIIGGMTLWKYLQSYRTTKDVDFLITVQGAPATVKNKLLALPNSPFSQPAQVFSYKGLNGRPVQIDITPDWQSPYLPDAAVPVSAVQLNSLPYISALDLLVFKINCCGLRADMSKKAQDATDARTLLEHIRAQGPIVLAPSQKTTVLQGLDDVAQYSFRDVAWWKTQLCLT